MFKCAYSMHSTLTFSYVLIVDHVLLLFASRMMTITLILESQNLYKFKLKTSSRAIIEQLIGVLIDVCIITNE
jgi:hypothetical protein